MSDEGWIMPNKGKKKIGFKELMDIVIENLLVNGGWLEGDYTYFYPLDSVAKRIPGMSVVKVPTHLTINYDDFKKLVENVRGGRIDFHAFDWHVTFEVYEGFHPDNPRYYHIERDNRKTLSNLEEDYIDIYNEAIDKMINVFDWIVKIVEDNQFK